jgi:hypothetical protein
MIFVILLFLCICTVIFSLFVYMKPTLLFGEDDTTTKKKIISEQSVYPEYLGMKGPDVLLEINSKYPQYTLEIVAPDYVNDVDKSVYREDRLRIYVSRGGLVQKIIKG